MKNKLIVVVGNVGTGKSSLCRLLAKGLQAKLQPADEFYKENPFFQLAVKDRKRWSFTSDVWFLKERVKLARESEGYLERSDVVMDSGLVMSRVYTHSRLAHGYFSQDEWQLYQECYRVFTKGLKEPDVVVYLKGQVELLRERVEKRGREFEVKFHDKAYLSGLAESLEVVVGEMKKKGVRVVEADTERVNFVKNRQDYEQVEKRVEE